MKKDKKKRVCCNKAKALNLLREKPDEVVVEPERGKVQVYHIRY